MSQHNVFLALVCYSGKRFLDQDSMFINILLTVATVYMYLGFFHNIGIKQVCSAA